jgi:HlyD family secretion protein
MNRKALVFGGLALVFIGAIMLPKLTSNEKGKEVEVTAAANQSISSSILASGTLAYREQVQLRSEVIGKVQELWVEEADTVSEGDLIIRLDPEQYQAALEQQEANVRLTQIAIERQQVTIADLERQLRRSVELARNNLVDQQTHESLENTLALARVDLRSRREQLSQAEAALAQARDQLDRTEIRSPIDGIVIQVGIKVGETVIAGTTNIPGSTLVVIADPSEMLAEVRVDEADIAQVRAAQDADIYASAFPDTPLHGIVETIATYAQQAPGQQSLSFLVKVLLSDPSSIGVRPGMSARAEIYTQSSTEALSVPVQAVQYDDEVEDGAEEVPYVMVVEDDRAVRRDVELGLSSDSLQEITSGLELGELVVSGPYRELRTLRDGDLVTIVEEGGGDGEDDEAEGAPANSGD